MSNSARDRHLFSAGPKRILALDGGGIRGVLTLRVLDRIEHIVRLRTGNADASLSDYFDLIGGTSTGAIIAAGLAMGWKVEKLSQMYDEFGDAVFQSDYFRRGLLRPKFSEEVLVEQLKAKFGDVKLGGDELRTGLAVVMKRLDTGSPWVVFNNPRGKYFEQRPGSTAARNKNFLVREVVRASSAAPTYFKPEQIEVAAGQPGAFVDGGVSPHNNPALQLLMLATISGHGLSWPVGEDNILMVSVGTGNSLPNKSPDSLMKARAATLGITALASLMDDANTLNETLLQWLSHSPTARNIDREIGDLSNDLLGGQAMLTYLRYQAWLDKTWLRDVLNIDVPRKELDGLSKMDKPENIDRLKEIGNAVAERLVEERHFPARFDV
jgi:uncharacterized protein